ncbi:MAG: FtsX-like permease family protein [Acidimicrobiia bacterium]|nr:FtsX-like permease family protein [Acidimicrobiia bacterium]
MNGASMRFVMTLAARELRASWRRLLVFFACIAIGVSAIVALRSVVQNVGVALTADARSMFGADLIISSNNPITGVVRQEIAGERTAGRVLDAIDAIELTTMARSMRGPDAGARVVELRAVDAGYPMYGTLVLREGTYRHDLLRDHGALVGPDLLAQLGLDVGDVIGVGDARFEVRGVVASEPGRSVGAFSFGPRVVIDRADLASTGLLSFGSRVSYEVLLRVPETHLDPLADSLRASFVTEYVRVRTYRRAEDRLGENLSRAENYLSLVGLVILALGGIGISSVVRVFVQEKIRSVAILKCLGATTRQVLAAYLTQASVLAAAGCVVGVLIAAGVLAAVPALTAAAPVQVAAMARLEYGLTVSAVAQGVAVGLLVALLFALVPLLQVRDVKPSLLLRHEITPREGIDWTRWSAAAAVAAALVAVATWQAGSVEIALIVCGGLVALTIVLHGAGLALVRAVQPLARARSFALRHAVLQVARPGSQAGIVLLSVGLGVFFILGVRALQGNLLADISLQIDEDAPDLFLLDVQGDQRDGLAAFVDTRNGEEPPPAAIPVLRARVVGVNGRELNLDGYQDVRGRGSLAREYTVTYREHLEDNETLLDGRWWTGGDRSVAEVSIEESLRERYRIHLGDEMRFDLFGRIISARVTSVREVEWRDFRSGGFMFVFSPGTFDDAPHGFIATARGPADPEARAVLISGLSARYPNVSVIDVQEALRLARDVMATVTRGVTVVGALVLLSGTLILVGAVSMTKFRRVYEAAVLKTLGASTRLIGMTLLLEYTVLGAIAGTIGAAGAVVLSWAIATWGLELPWTPAPGLSVAGVLLTTLLVAVVGVLASLEVLRHKPLDTLRAE